MDAKLESAALDLDEAIKEWNAVLNADPDTAGQPDSVIAIDGQPAHLGRIAEAGKRYYERYLEIAGNNADKELLARVPALFK